MNFIKNFNNNTALVADQAGNEWIVLGKGGRWSKARPTY